MMNKKEEILFKKICCDFRTISAFSIFLMKNDKKNDFNIFMKWWITHNNWKYFFKNDEKALKILKELEKNNE